MTIQFIRFNKNENTLEAYITDNEKTAKFKHNVSLNVWLNKLSHSQILNLLIDKKPIVNLEFWTQTSDFRKFESSRINSWN